MADAAQPPPQDEQPASADSGPRRSIVVLGAGVIGLSVAHALSEDKRNDITIVARDMPEHLDSQGWSSPWAVRTSASISVSYLRNHTLRFRFRAQTGALSERSTRGRTNGREQHCKLTRWLHIMFLAKGC